MTGETYGSELVLVAAPDEAALVTAVRKLATFLDQAPDVALRDVAYTCARSYAAQCEQPAAATPPTLAVVASSVADLRTRLALVESRLAAGVARVRDRSGTWYFRDRPLPEGRLAFLFPGVGSFYVDMLRTLAVRFPQCRSPFDELEEALGSESGPFAPGAFVFPPANCYRHDADVFAAGGFAEAMVSVYSANVALARLFAACGVKPDGSAGFLGGDLAALSTSGYFGDFPRPKRVAFLREMYNVVAKTSAAVTDPETREYDPERGAAHKSLFRKFADHWIARAPISPVYSCASADVLPAKARKARDLSAALWTQPVRFGDTVKKMYEDGFRVFLEVGPRSALTVGVHDALHGLPHWAVPANFALRSSRIQFASALGAIAALGRRIDPRPLFAGRRVRALDFDAPLAIEVRADRERTLGSGYPQLKLPGGVPMASPAKPARRGAARAAAAKPQSVQMQFDYGLLSPLLHNARTLSETPGVAVEVEKTFTFRDEMFLADYARGTSQLSYSSPDLRGLALFPLAAAAEAMAELAQTLVPNRHLVAIDNLESRRAIAFSEGALDLILKAERIASSDPDLAVVNVQIRGEAWTSAAFEGRFVFSAHAPDEAAFVPEPLGRARSVHWTDRDIYPERLSSGELLRFIRSADVWSEGGLDYEVEVPPREGAVKSRIPIWTVDPRLLTAVMDGFALWRSHESNAGFTSTTYPFRLGRLSLHAQPGCSPEGARLKCYLRSADVTPESIIGTVHVTGGNGKLLMALEGFEVRTARVREEYCRLLLSPASTYLTRSLEPARLGSPDTAIASAVATDVPYAFFAAHEELWLKTVSQIVLDKMERRTFAGMTGSAARRAEWLFGRIAAKEAVRRFLSENCHARWADADVQIWADENGKPHALGEWSQSLPSRLDLAIAHTKEFVVAVVAANARVGVDVEAEGRDLTDEFTRGVFTPEELELAAGVLTGTAAPIRFWCAKEAVSKALGCGIRYSPRELVVESFQAETGDMEVSLRGQWLEQFKAFKGRMIRVSSVVEKGHVLAACFIPETLFI